MGDRLPDPDYPSWSKGPPPWVTASFTLDEPISQRQYVEPPDTDTFDLLTLERFRYIIALSVPDAVGLIWREGRLFGRSPLPPTPPLSDEDDDLPELKEPLKKIHEPTGGFFTDYLNHILSRLHMSGSHLITALVLLQRIRSSYGNRKLSASSIVDHRQQPRNAELQAYIFCLLLAHKLSEDRAYDNRTWSHLTGWSVEAVNRCETRILLLLEHRVAVDKEEFYRTFRALDERYGYRATFALAKSDLDSLLQENGRRRSESHSL